MRTSSVTIDSLFRREFLCGVWTLMVAVLAIGHATALRNTLTVLVVLATLALYARRNWSLVPCKLEAVLLIAWAAASVAWSPTPDVSLGKVRTDLLLPLTAYVAAFCIARSARGFMWIMVGMGLGLLALAFFSAFEYLPHTLTPAGILLKLAAGIINPLPYWYPGPGDASMFAILCVGPSLALRRLESRGGKWLAWTALGLLLFVAVTTNNRAAAVVLPLAIALDFFLNRKHAQRRGGGPTQHRSAEVRSRSRHVALVAVGVVAACVILATVLELGARDRLRTGGRPPAVGSSAIELAMHDTRPQIWSYYLRLGMTHPIIGAGFGRTVPGVLYQTESDKALAALDSSAYSHAHNLFINWWLQLGIVGLVLLLLLLFGLLRSALRLLRSLPATNALAVAIVVTLAAAIARNLTDDFLIYGMATMFWTVLGALFGEATRRNTAASATNSDATLIARLRRESKFTHQVKRPCRS